MKGAKILIVDDEPQILRVLRPALTASGYDVVGAATATEALGALRDGMPDLVILDLGLPDMDGKEALRKMRVLTNRPIIVLSARDRESEKVMALDLGADDYIEKPFGMDELLARMRAALRHAKSAAEPERIRIDGLTIDIGKRLVQKRGETLKLTPKEFDLLVFLARRAGRPVSHREILKAVWGPAHENDSQYLRVFVGQLRGKIEDDPANPRLLTTEPGVGYRCCDNA
ncbi:response regulator [Methylocystis parvus]|uniref:Response regulator transcription factor n=1 Tax=Methylocystis parvus TaxID=134 RepID=A0A6B8M9Y1_9HYPH|nr:response regulator transcription factor [Methylocystis parvus]QGM98409.1 response regulator transcription factor [Methylocystis parvus]WBK01258.1 response regulator transcription factor [Methylocystis parvus OBBP]